MKTICSLRSTSSRLILCALLIGVSQGTEQVISMSGTPVLNNIENTTDSSECESCDAIKISFQSRLEAAQLSVSDLSHKNQGLGVNLAQAEDKLAKSEEQQKVLATELKSTQSEISQLSKDLEKMTSQFETVQKANNDLMEKLSASDSELKRLQEEAATQYCNITNIKSDAKQFTERKFKEALEVAKVAYNENAAPLVENAKTELSVRSAALMKDMEPHISSGEQAYRVHVEPHFQTAKSTVSNLYNEHGKPLLDEAVVTTRVKMVSGLEVLSRNTMDYVKTLKDEEMKEASKSHNKIPYDDIISKLAAVEKKSEDIVEGFLKLSVKLVLAVMFLRVFKGPLKFAFSVVMLPVRIVLTVIWLCLFPVRLLVGGKRK